MVQAIENWTCVTGTVKAAPRRDADGHGWLEIEVARCHAAKGFTSLLKAEPGESLRIRLRAGWPHEHLVKAGVEVTLPVRLARPGQMFAHPDWRPDAPSALCDL